MSGSWGQTCWLCEDSLCPSFSPHPKIYEGVSSLLDKLGVWYHPANGTSDLKEMAQTGLRILVGYILLQDPQVGHPFPGLRSRLQLFWVAPFNALSVCVCPLSCTHWPT